MQAIVLGSGVIGVASAYYLAKQGIKVRVFDRQAGAAQETSFANAGQISPGYSTPWAAPGIPAKAAKWLLQKHAPLAWRPDGSAFQMAWLKSMLQNCNRKSYAVNKERMMRLSEYSRDCLRELRAQIDLPYEERAGGVLQLFRKKAQLEAMRLDAQVLEECGVPYEVIAADDLPSVEPALAYAQDKAALLGGLRLPNDETGDCYLFTTRLAERCQALGVEFFYNRHIDSLVVEQGKIAAAIVNGERQSADVYVLALGSYSRAMLLPLGLALPVYPVKGYSLTMPIVDETRAPISTVLDETYKIAITRFDRRIRVGGMAELVGFDKSLNPAREATLRMVAGGLFDGGDDSRAEFWTGLRPMTPDGTPIVGKTRFGNLYLNTGHGTLGWTMACGSGRLLADVIAERPPQISLEGLSVDRYSK